MHLRFLQILIALIEDVLLRRSSTSLFVDPVVTIVSLLAMIAVEDLGIVFRWLWRCAALPLATSALCIFVSFSVALVPVAVVLISAVSMRTMMVSVVMLSFSFLLIAVSVTAMLGLALPFRRELLLEIF